MRAAYIHVFGDIIQSIGVLIASIVITIWPSAKIIDPLLTFVFSVIVLCTTLRIMRDCLVVLMEGTPARVDVQMIKAKLQTIEGVEYVHDLHVWAISIGKNSLTCHI